MEYIVLIVICLLLLVLLWYILGINIKKVKEIGENKELDELTNTFPENIDICKSILKKLGNKNVNIKEDNESKTSLYVIVGNSITIANIRNSYTRIQTVAHECIHSIQNKKMLWFNFIYTNVYVLYFILISILTLTKVITKTNMFLNILIVMSMVQYFVRSMLETDAMTKARYVAKEYLEENNICAKEKIEKIIANYDSLNEIGIKLVNYDILCKNIIKVVIYIIICIII